jgi:hypothetical protein
MSNVSRHSRIAMQSPQPSFRQRLLFKVTSAQLSVQAQMENGAPVAGAEASFVLRANRDTPIRLSTGEPLESFDVHFSLSSSRNDGEVNEYVSAGVLGFLCHVPASSPRENLLLHGRASWPKAPLPEALFGSAEEATCIMELADIPLSGEFDAPYVWQPYRDGALRIASYTFACSKVYRSMGSHGDG